QLQGKASNIMAQNVSSMRAAEEFGMGIREIRTQMTTFSLTGDRKYLEAVPGLRRETDYWLAQIDRPGLSPAEQELLSRVKRAYAKFFAEFEELTNEGQVAAAGPAARALAQVLLRGEILPCIRQSLELNQALMAQNSEASQRMVQRMALALLTIGTSGAAAGLLAGVGIARA